MTRQELIDLLKAEVGKQVGERVEAALAKAEENRTKWMEQILHGLQKATPPTPPEKGILVGRMARAVAAGKNDVDKAIQFARKAWKGEDAEEVVKALSAGTGSEGGYLVPTVRSTDFIELLRPRVIVRRLGATEYPLTGGNAEIPKQTAGTTATYIGENQDIGAQKPAFGMIKLTAKKLAALVPISNDLLRYNNPAADGIVRDDLLNGVRVREDLAFIRDNGTSFTPKGIRYWVAAANVLSMTASPDLQKITTDLGRMILALEEGNVAFTRPGWMFAPRTRHGLMTIRDANGNLAYAAEMARQRDYCPLGNRHLKSKKSRIKMLLEGGAHLGRIPVNSLILGDATRYAAARRKGGVGNATINRDVAVLVHALNWGVAQGYLRDNPLRHWKKLREDRKPPREDSRRRSRPRSPSCRRRCCRFTSSSTRLAAGEKRPCV